MKKLLVCIGLVAICIGFRANAWQGEWVWTEECNVLGKVNVTAIYTASDNLDGTVQYTSQNLNVLAGATVTANLVEDNNQLSTYLVTNIYNCHLNCAEGYIWNDDERDCLPVPPPTPPELPVTGINIPHLNLVLGIIWPYLLGGIIFLIIGRRLNRKV